MGGFANFGGDMFGMTQGANMFGGSQGAPTPMGADIQMPGGQAANGSINWNNVFGAAGGLMGGAMPGMGGMNPTGMGGGSSMFGRMNPPAPAFSNMNVHPMATGSSGSPTATPAPMNPYAPGGGGTGSGGNSGYGGGVFNNNPFQNVLPSGFSNALGSVFGPGAYNNEISMLNASMQPQYQQGMAALSNQYGAGNAAFGSEKALGASNYSSQFGAQMAGVDASVLNNWQNNLSGLFNNMIEPEGTYSANQPKGWDYANMGMGLASMAMFG